MSKPEEKRGGEGGGGGGLILVDYHTDQHFTFIPIGVHVQKCMWTRSTSTSFILQIIKWTLSKGYA